MSGHHAQTIGRSVIAPLLGMSLFWPFFRYASYFMLLYPLGRTSPFPMASRGSVSTHVGFLAVLAVLAAVVFVLHGPTSRFIDRRRPFAALFVALGSAASAIALAVGNGTLASMWLWPSVLLAALSFLFGYLCWADHFSAGFDSSQILLLGSSLLLSYILFSREGLLGSVAGGWLAALLMPVGTAACWLFSKPAAEQQGASSARGFDAAGLAHPLALIMATFLLVGGAVRGIVDVQSTMAGTRFGLSVILTVLLVAACLLHWRHSSRTGLSTTAFVLICWLALVAVFLIGLFVFLVLGDQGLGGDIVVVSRTVMEFTFWALLCRIACTQRILPVPFFLALGISVELVSWVISYAVVPGVYGASGASEASGAFVLGVIFSVTAIMLVIIVWYLIWAFRRDGGFASLLNDGIAALERGGLNLAGLPDASPGAPDQGTGQTQAAQQPPAASDADLVDRLMSDGRLTAREAQVAVMYAHGHSLAKVAEQLVISKSTAQTHIKAAYRKLDVHNRDELIERLEM